jgi:hypothetical protein
VNFSRANQQRLRAIFYLQRIFHSANSFSQRYSIDLDGHHSHTLARVKNFPAALRETSFNLKFFVAPWRKLWKSREN